LHEYDQGRTICCEVNLGGPMGQLGNILG